MSDLYAGCYEIGAGPDYYVSFVGSKEKNQLVGQIQCVQQNVTLPAVGTGTGPIYLMGDSSSGTMMFLVLTPSTNPVTSLANGMINVNGQKTAITGAKLSSISCNSSGD